MTCPVCGGNTRVICSRTDNETIARRRKCLECSHIFYTEEYETKDAKQLFTALELQYKQDLETK